MNPELQNLIVLQDVDREIHRLRQEVSRYPALREARLSDLERARRQLEEARVEKIALEKRVRESERQVCGWRESLGKFNAQQMRVKTQKEYDALSHEMEETRRKISEADEQGLTSLEQEEAVIARIAELEKVVSQKDASCKEEVARLDEREKEKQAELAAYEARRTDQAAQVSPPLLHRYGRLAEQHAGPCVVPVKDGNCGGCFVRIIPMQMQEMARSEAIVECDHCHRFLYIPA